MCWVICERICVFLRSAPPPTFVLLAAELLTKVLKRRPNEHRNAPLLTVMSCIQLASKLVIADKCVTVSEVENFLQKANQNYDKKTIIASEIRVFEQLDFHVPLFTVLDLVNQLIDSCANSVREVSEFYLMCGTLVKLMYLSYDDFTLRLQWTAGKEMTEMETKSFKKLLAASIIYASDTLCRGEGSIDLLQNLAKRNDYTYMDIEGISNIVMSLSYLTREDFELRVMNAERHSDEE